MATYTRNIADASAPPSLLSRGYEFRSDLVIQKTTGTLITVTDKAGFEYRLAGDGLGFNTTQNPDGSFQFTPAGSITAIFVTGAGGGPVYESIEGLPSIPFSEPSFKTTSGIAELLFGASDTFNGSAQRDKFWGVGGNDILDGKGGVDTAIYRGAAAEYTVTVSGSGLVVADMTTTRDGTDTLTAVERLQFSDKILAFDDLAAQAYRIYQAAFARTPDIAGLSYWVKTLDGGLSMRDVAYGFVESAEFKAAYGASPSNLQLVEKLYLNVLGRAAEKAGVDYWVGLLDVGTSRLDVVAAISESAENKTNLAAIIGQGVQLDLTVGV